MSRIFRHLIEPLGWGAALYVLMLPLMFFGEGVTEPCNPPGFLCARVVSWGWGLDLNRDNWGILVAGMFGFVAAILAFWSADILLRGRERRSKLAMIGPIGALAATAIMHVILPFTIFTDAAQSDWLAVRIANLPFMAMFGFVIAVGIGALMYLFALGFLLARRVQAARPAAT